MAPDSVTLLWTGGWDSTFRLLQLLLIEKRNVQPVYVMDVSRYSMNRELDTISQISAMVRQRLDSGVTLYPTKFFLSSDFPEIQEIRDRYLALKNKYHVARQYYWLALIAENQQWESVELSMVRTQTPSDLETAIFNNIEGENPTLKDSWEAELFKYWSFPLLTTKKSEMKVFAEENGFLDILLKRWFCLRPIRGKCCGACLPCEVAQREQATEGVEFIHPAETAARKLYRETKRLFT
ncbi:hypothetical protein FDP08_03410 [Marinobacter panjinensis]|uniref:7-cyano-7-deazaguanine synthase n=1 Tax=Marinobacter panjinensis TaxID=2576384 RepID=A0A4U6R313_9GAMM|nr:hypothetical protein [Marinobacter panjinensis]MCR8915821.1 hypothetical protein [Marinobacter panjinensis]TKV67202.1 hypothetical protein FDP08_03410 [Marinobacter panjinensis]